MALPGAGVNARASIRTYNPVATGRVFREHTIDARRVEHVVIAFRCL